LPFGGKLKDFITDVVRKVLKELDIPFSVAIRKDQEFLLCINKYGTLMLQKRRKISPLYTFMVLMDCKNEYEDVLKGIKELGDEIGNKGVNIDKVSSIKTYRSKILNEYLNFDKNDFPECIFNWEKKLKEI